jgi:Protein of unknown function (DUF2800)
MSRMKNSDNVAIIPPGEHSPLGPSSSKRGINCSGSIKASKGATEDESPYAAEGTALHYLSELCRNQNEKALCWIGHKFKVGKFTFEVDQEFADTAQAFVDWCAEQPGKPLTEQRVDYSGYFPASTIKEFGPAFGTLDDARLLTKVCYITDFKGGKGIQEYAEENTQLLLQALGVYEAFNWIYDFEGFQLQICQPRLNHFDSWYISVADLLTWAGNTIPAWGLRAEEGTQFKAGSWCRFCRIRKKCAVRANAGVQAMLEQGEFEDLDQLEVHALRARNAGHMITTEELVKILPSLDIFKAWIKDMEKRAVSELIAGDKTLREHYKLVEGRSNRKWKGSVEDIENAMPPEGPTLYEKPEMKSVSVLEKELGKKGFAELFGKFVDKPHGKPKLVPASDKRAEITGQALVEFDNLDDEELQET